MASQYSTRPPLVHGFTWARGRHGRPRIRGWGYREHMSARFTYSRWDGTQQGFELDGDALLEELTDELLYHGDVNAALRRMMHQGLRDRNGDRLQGVRELLEKLRQERQDRLDRFDLGGVYDEIARELNDIVDEERHAIDNAVREA